MTATTKPRPLAWLCELMQEDGSVRQQIVTENPDGIRWNDSGEPSPFRVTPLYAAIDAQTPQPVNGIKATEFHDEGAIAQCGSCGRYTMDPDALHQRFRLICDCGDMHGWSGSFKKPGPDARWHGAAPAQAPQAAPAPSKAAVQTDPQNVRRELMAFARRDVITDRDRILIGAAIGHIGATPPEQAATPSPEQIAAARRTLIAETLGEEPCVIGAGCADPRAAPVALTSKHLQHLLEASQAMELSDEERLAIALAYTALSGIRAAAQGGEHG